MILTTGAILGGCVYYGYLVESESTMQLLGQLVNQWLLIRVTF